MEGLLLVVVVSTLLRVAVAGTSISRCSRVIRVVVLVLLVYDEYFRAAVASPSVPVITQLLVAVELKKQIMVVVVMVHHLNAYTIIVSTLPNRNPTQNLSNDDLK